MNKLFLGLIFTAFLVTLGRDLHILDPLQPIVEAQSLSPHFDVLTKSMLSSAEIAVEICLGLIGILALWMGVLKVAEQAGLIQLLAQFLHPVLRRLFPEIPKDHPALGAIVMNVAANMLGLGNAATPMGLKAMGYLQELNTKKEEASDAMCLFLAINTSGLTLIPTRAIALRMTSESHAPTSIVLPTILATAVSTIVAVIAAKTFRYFASKRSNHV